MNKYATVALVCLSILVVSCNSLEKAGNVLITEITKSTSPPEARPRDAEQIKKSVVRITAKESGQGTGFVVGVNGDTAYILTARHVVAGDSAPSVEFFGKVGKFNATVENDRNVDVSLLTVTGPIPPEAIPLYVVKAFEPQTTDSMFTFGFPVDIGKLSHERLSYSSTEGSDILFSGNITGGHSGGPVMKGDEVIGMVTAVDRHVRVLRAEIIRASLNEIILSDMERWQGSKWQQASEARLKEMTMLRQPVIQPATAVVDEKLPEGTIIAFAAAPGGNARDGFDEHSPYTKFLLQEMQKSQQIEKVFQNVSRLVKEDTEGQQVAWYNASLSSGSFCFGGCSKTSSNSIKRLALVIGNKSYREVRLRCSINDAQAIAKVLKEKGFEVLLRTDTNLSEMKEAIQEFIKRLSVEDGVGLFYLSGAGGQIEGKDYLFPVDFSVENRHWWEDNMVSVDSIVEQMQSANSKLNIVILDSSRSEFSRSEGR